MALKVAKYLGIFQYSQDLSKIAQSGHTGERERDLLGVVESFHV